MLTFKQAADVLDSKYIIGKDVLLELPVAPHQTQVHYHMTVGYKKLLRIMERFIIPYDIDIGFDNPLAGESPTAIAICFNDKTVKEFYGNQNAVIVHIHCSDKYDCGYIVYTIYDLMSKKWRYKE